MQQLHFWPIKFPQEIHQDFNWNRRRRRKMQKINMSKSHTFQPALNPPCGNSILTKGITTANKNICSTPEMNVTLEAPAAPLGRNDQALLVAFLSVSRHEQSCWYLQCWAAPIQAGREWQWYLGISQGPVHPPLLSSFPGQSRGCLCSSSVTEAPTQASVLVLLLT